MMRGIRLAYCNQASHATMIRGASPRRVTGMVQKTLIASRSFQPGVMSTDVSALAFGRKRIREIAHLNRFANEILNSQNITQY